MMITTEPRMTNLFLQLGLDASDAAIARFIVDHQLPAEVAMVEAPYWNDGQRQFLAEQLQLRAIETVSPGSANGTKIGPSAPCATPSPLAPKSR